MPTLLVRRRLLTLSALTAATLAVAACTDKRVKQLNTGITRDSALSVIAQNLPPNSGPDSLPNVYRRARYIIEGKQMEVLYFTSNNEKEGGPDTIPVRKLTPLVFLNNVLIGKDWAAWDSIAKANNILVEGR
jgi:hypothetical protein